MQIGLVAPKKMVTVAWMATVKSQGWGDAALGMGGLRPYLQLLNSYPSKNEQRHGGTVALERRKILYRTKRSRDHGPGPLVR